KPRTVGITTSAATTAKRMLPALHSTSVSDSVRTRHRDAASDASRPRRTSSSTASASGARPNHVDPPPSKKKSANNPTIASAAPNDIRTTWLRNTNDNGPITTAGGTSSQRTYLREKDRRPALSGRPTRNT